MSKYTYHVALYKPQGECEIVTTDDWEVAADHIELWTSDVDTYKKEGWDFQFKSNDDIFIWYVLEYLERLGILKTQLEKQDDEEK